MPPKTVVSPGLHSFLRSLKQDQVGKSVHLLASLIQRNQITGTKACAVATTQLLLRVVADFKDRDIWLLFDRIRQVGRLLVDAQPRAFVVGNIIRRTLSLVREIAEDRQHGGRTGTTGSQTVAAPASDSSSSTIVNGNGNGNGGMMANGPVVATSLFELFSRPDSPSPAPTPPATAVTTAALASAGLPNSVPTQTPTSTLQSALAGLQIQQPKSAGLDCRTAKDEFRADVLEGIREMLDEIEQVDDQIASYSTDHIHSNETILIHSASMTVQKFLLAAAKKRKFTVIHVESYPNERDEAQAMMVKGVSAAGAAEEPVGTKFRPLTAAGITVISVPDSAVFAMMSQVNKVILGPHAVLANGGLVASAGAHAISLAAQTHKIPVVVLTGVYRLSPVYPFMSGQLVTAGQTESEADSLPLSVQLDRDGTVFNALTDFVSPELVDLYITNLGGHAPSYLYRIVADHYHQADLNL